MRHVLRPLAGGNRRAVLLVEGPHGLAVAKQTRLAEPALHWLDRVIGLAARAGLQPPRFYPAPGGEFSVGGWTLETYCAGRALPMSRLPELAPALARFHASVGGLPARPDGAGAAALLRGGAWGAPLGPGLRQRCLRAWRRLPQQISVIHGDMSAGNVIARDDGRLALIDWDEARVDFTAFDTMQLGRPGRQDTAAHLAWEVYSCWRAEPRRARRLSGALQRRGGGA